MNYIHAILLVIVAIPHAAIGGLLGDSIEAQLIVPPGSFFSPREIDRQFASPQIVGEPLGARFSGLWTYTQNTVSNVTVQAIVRNEIIQIRFSSSSAVITSGVPLFYVELSDLDSSCDALTSCSVGGVSLVSKNVSNDPGVVDFTENAILLGFNTVGRGAWVYDFEITTVPEPASVVSVALALVTAAALCPRRV